MVKNVFIKFEDDRYKKLKHLLVEYGLTWDKLGEILTNHVDKVEEIVKEHKKSEDSIQFIEEKSEAE